MDQQKQYTGSYAKTKKEEDRVQAQHQKNDSQHDQEHGNKQANPASGHHVPEDKEEDRVQTQHQKDDSQHDQEHGNKHANPASGHHVPEDRDTENRQKASRSPIPNDGKTPASGVQK